MASILDLLNSNLGKELITAASEKTKATRDKTANVLSAAMPLILGAMKRNAATPEGAVNLNKALSDARHDGSVLENLSGALCGSSLDALLQDGGSILSHVLGSKQERVEQTISKTVGVDASSVAQIIKMAAPILMSVLGSQKRKDNVKQDGLEGLLGTLLGSQSDHDQSFLETILDRGNDGNIMDDVAGMLTGSKKKGGLLGDLF